MFDIFGTEVYYASAVIYMFGEEVPGGGRGGVLFVLL